MSSLGVCSQTRCRIYYPEEFPFPAPHISFLALPGTGLRINCRLYLQADKCSDLKLKIIIYSNTQQLLPILAVLFLSFFAHANNSNVESCTLGNRGGCLSTFTHLADAFVQSVFALRKNTPASVELETWE